MDCLDANRYQPYQPPTVSKGLTQYQYSLSTNVPMEEQLRYSKFGKLSIHFFIQPELSQCSAIQAILLSLKWEVKN